MHDVVCMRCGEEIDWVYQSKNPDWVGWDLCAQCVRECDAEIVKDTDGAQTRKAE